MEENASSQEAKTQAKEKAMEEFKIELPQIKELLKSGVQFGHETKRWNPKMRKYIFGTKNDIHVIDVSQTLSQLEKASAFLAQAASKGPVLIVGTKKQAAKVIKEEAFRSNSFFVDKRWAGGLLTNFPMVTVSLKKLLKLEEDFETGVEGRTKYEVSLMKKEWARLDRLYSGVKQMTDKPSAVVILDVKYEKNALNEALLMGIPVVGIVDTNSDPDRVNYVIPANDDAIGSIKILLKTLADAVIEGSKGKGIKHNLVDYSKVEIKITKTKEVEEEELGKQVSALVSQKQNEIEKIDTIKARGKRVKVEEGLLTKATQKAKVLKISKVEALKEKKKKTKKQS